VGQKSDGKVYSGGTHVGQRPPAHGGEGLEGVGVGGVGVLELRSATAVPEELNS
jgi:hypothetical protein